MTRHLLDACAEALVIAGSIQSSAHSLSVAELRSRFSATLDDMVASARRADVAEGDVAEARYALVAFMDEQVLRSNWPGRTEWMARPLQLEMYRESTAGENFFVRLRAHLSGARSTDAIEVYYLCLLFGFAGAYAGEGGAESLEKFKRAARSRLARDWPDSRRMSPRATRSGELSSSPNGWASLLALVAAGSLACLTVVIGLAWVTQSRLDDVVSRLATRVQLEEPPR